MVQINKQRDVQEAYATAVSSSNLRVDSAALGDVDVLIAAGWNPSRVGGALMRLLTEWDSAAHTRPVDMAHFLPGCRRDAARAAAQALAAAPDEESIKAVLCQVDKDARAQASAMAERANEREVMLLLARLKTLPTVRALLADRLRKWGVQEAGGKADALARWWVQRTCQACQGTKFQPKAAKACKICGGLGEAPLPCGQEGRRLANWMDDCVERWRQANRKVLRYMSNRG